MIAQGHNALSSLTVGYHETFMIGAVLATIGLLITVVVLWTPAKEVVRAQTVSVLGEGELFDLEVMAGEF